MGRPISGAGVDRVAAFVRDNKRLGVVNTNVGSKHTRFELSDGRKHFLTPADLRKLPEGFPR